MFRIRPSHRTRALAALLLFAAARQASHAQAKAVTGRTAGTFEVTLTPQPADSYADGTALGRSTADKKYYGDLEGSSKGQMLTGLTDVKDSAGYVAIERVTGTLGGRRGSFLLQHYGIMLHGTQSQTVSVIPDSGTGELVGLSGTMTPGNSGNHSYLLTYSLPN